MSRKGENIYHRKDGRWEGRYRIEGEKKYRSVYAESYSACKLLRNECMKKAAQNSAKEPDFGTACAKWLEYKKQLLKTSSYAKYRAVIEKHLLPYFGAKESLPKTMMLRNYIRLLIQKKYSSRTIHIHFKLLKQILSFSAPDSVKLFEEVKKELPKELPPQIQILTEQQRTLFANYLEKDMDNEKMAIYLALSLGLRIGEICALQWCDIDFDRRIISIKKTMQRIQSVPPGSQTKTLLQINPPKTTSGMRELPIPDRLFLILERFRADASCYLTTGSCRYIEPRSLSNIFHSHLTACNLPPIRFHALRHTFATRFAEQVNDYKALSEILGHSSASVTMTYYIHLSEEYKRNSIEKSL